MRAVVWSSPSESRPPPDRIVPKTRACLAARSLMAATSPLVSGMMGIQPKREPLAPAATAADDNTWVRRTPPLFAQPALAPSSRCAALTVLLC